MVRLHSKYQEAWNRFKFFQLKARGTEPVLRAYSLANPPFEKGILRFTIRIATPPPGRTDIPPGIGSSYVFNLKPGDRVTLSGPYGDFFVKETFGWIARNNARPGWRCYAFLVDKVAVGSAWPQNKPAFSSTMTTRTRTLVV